MKKGWEERLTGAFLHGWCPLCGQVGEHDQAACDAKMVAWKPTGLLLAADFDPTVPYQPAAPLLAPPPREAPEMTDPDQHLAEHVYATFVDDLPYCGCGNPDAAMTLVVQILNLTPTPGDVGDRDRSGEIRALCGTPASTQFVLAAIDGAGLTEHGGSLYSAWLTGRGAWLLWAVGRLGGVEGLDGRLDDVGYPECWVDGGCPESHRMMPGAVASGG